MDARTALSLLFRHPDILLSKGIGRIATRMGSATTPRTIRLGGVTLELPSGPDPRLRLMRWGLYEPESIHILRTYLRPGGIFIDVGASIGYLSAAAAGVVGPEGAVHAFEPAPAFHERLLHLARRNPGHRFEIQGCALGEEEGTGPIWISSGENIGWNTMVPGFMRPSSESHMIRTEVPVIPFDDHVARHDLREISLIKIDTEGYELPVLLGMRRTLESGLRPPILCEVAPGAYPLLDRRVEDLFDYLATFSYRGMDPFVRARPVGSPGA